MKRYIYSIVYNKSDKSVDKVFVDAFTRDEAEKKLKIQFPGVYEIRFVKIEKDL